MEASLLLVTATILASLVVVNASNNLIIKNNCPYPIWPAIQDQNSDPDSPRVGEYGFLLDQGGFKSVEAPHSWSGYIWARTLCSTDASGNFSCQTGDCGTGQVECNPSNPAHSQPISQAHISLNSGDERIIDYYEVSLMDGFNVPVSVAPLPPPEGPECASKRCPVDINAVCPSQLAARNSSGSVIGCKAACYAFGTDEECCRGDYVGAKNCTESGYTRFFKEQCPMAHAWVYEDSSEMGTCDSGVDYDITFCP